MEYRNIDTDYQLLLNIKRYYNQELSLDQLYWKLESEGYSKKEVESAIYDYYLIYIRTNVIQNFVVLLITLCLFFYLIHHLLTKISIL